MFNQYNFILCLYKNIIVVYVYGKGVTFEVLWFRYMGSNPSISYPSELSSQVANTCGSHNRG